MHNIFSAAENGTLGTGIAMFILLIVLTLVVCVGAIWFISYTINRDDNGNSPKMIFTVSLIVGIVLRFVFAALIRGHRDSYIGLIGYNSDVFGLINYGSAELYKNGVTTYPISIYILYIFSKLGSLLGFEINSIGMQMIIKIPMIACDVLSAALIYKLFSEFSSRYTAALVSALFILIPVTFFASVIWVSDLAFVLPLIILSFYYLAVKKYFGMFAAYSAALLTSKNAIYLFPIFAVFTILTFIKACKSMRGRSFTGGFKGLWKNEEVSAVVKLPIYFVGSLIISYILCLPLTIGAIKGNFFKWFSLVYLKPLVNIPVYGTNSLSIYNVFGRNGVGFNTNYAIWFVLACAIIITALTLSMYLGKRNRANLSLIGAFVLMTVFIYFIGFGAMDTLIVFPILLISFAFIKDKRLLTLFAIFSLAFILNAAGVMTYYGEFNNLLNTTPLGSPTFLNVINIIGSIIALLGHLYMIVVTLDISSGERRLFKNVSSKKFGENMKNWLLK